MLFKILHGDASRISTSITPYHEGYCYVTHNGDFYVDMNGERVKLNARDAETIMGASLTTILNENDTEIPTSKAVLTAIEASQIMHVGPDRPTDPNIKVWINTVEDAVPVLPRMTTISLRANGWVGNSEPYSQTIQIPTVTASSKIDLQPSAQQIVALQNSETSLMIDNDNGMLTCYAIGNKPTVDYNMQVLIQEVTLI